MKLSAAEKIYNVESTIEALLNASRIDWHKEKLYSWNWNPNNIKLSSNAIYGKSKPKKLYAAQVHEGLSGKLYKSDEKRMLGLANNAIVVELNVKLFDNIPAVNYVVTNIHPTKSMMKLLKENPDTTLYSAIGDWYTGLK
jgi:hypothetical protein